MRFSSFLAAAGVTSLALVVACVSDSAIGSSGALGDASTTADASASPDSGTEGDAGTKDDSSTVVGTKCSNDQVFDKESAIVGAGDATWFSVLPGERHAYYVAGGKLFSADLDKNGVENPKEISPKASSVSSAVDPQGKNLLAVRGNNTDVNTFVTWEEPSTLSLKGTSLEKFINASLLEDGKLMIARYDSSNGAGGDNKLHEFSVVAKHDSGTVTLGTSELALDAIASYPVYNSDGLALVYLSPSGLSYATRSNRGARFTLPASDLKRAPGILADARPHSLSKDNCRLYFTRTGGAFVASRTPNLP